VPDLLFHPDVALEIKSAYEWYERQARGLGEDYLSELESAYEAIIELPDTWPRFHKEFRRFLLSKFPFSIIYCSNRNSIYVVAVMHNHRRPGYWGGRV
jgi:toxin ParE1/3/4